MRTIDEIKAAAVALPTEEQIELFHWWVETDVFRQRHLAVLKRQIAAGIEDLEGGRYQAYDRSEVMRLAEDISKTGRDRLSASNKKQSK